MTSAPLAASGRDPYQHGLQLLQSGQPQAAVEQLQVARLLHPADPAVIYALGNGLRLCGRPEEAAEALSRALALQPDLVDAAFSLAFLYLQQTQTARIPPVLQALCRARPGDLQLQEKAANLLASAGEHAAAAEFYESLAEASERADLRLQLGNQYQKLGRYAEAAAAYQRAIDLDARLGPAYMLLANTRRYDDIDQAFKERCEAGLSQSGLGADDAACIEFALGKMHDDSGRHATAFEHYYRANLRRRPSTPFDRQAWLGLVERLEDAFQRVDFPPMGGLQPGPAFIVGMIRSGTTLLSRLLGNTSAIHAVGETELVDAFVQRIAEIKLSPYPDCVLQLEPEELGAIAADYRRRLPVDPQARWIMDKNPLNFIHVGLIALLFPGAPLIHCRRDPLDTCLSIYFQNFGHARANYAYDLEDIGAFYIGYRRLMAFWERRLPGRLIHMDYEDLVLDPDRSLPTLYEQLELSWVPAAARPQDNPATIATASVWQARQPIYTQSVGRWRHYASQLQGLREQLQNAGIELSPSHDGRKS